MEIFNFEYMTRRGLIVCMVLLANFVCVHTFTFRFDFVVPAGCENIQCTGNFRVITTTIKQKALVIIYV